MCVYKRFLKASRDTGSVTSVVITVLHIFCGFLRFLTLYTKKFSSKQYSGIGNAVSNPNYVIFIKKC